MWLQVKCNAKILAKRLQNFSILHVTATLDTDIQKMKKIRKNEENS